MVSPTSLVFEAEFSTGVWTDITADVLANEGINIHYGINGNGPRDRIASVGTMSFSLDNSAANSGAKLGYYSPDHANARSGFDIGLPLRCRIAYGTTYTKHIGEIQSITPAADQYGKRTSDVISADFIYKMALHKLQRIAVQTDKRDDQLITTIISNMNSSPESTSYSTGLETYPYALHDVKDESTTALNAVARCVQSGLGYFYIAGDGAATYKTRQSRISGVTSSVTLNDTMVDLQVSRPIEKVLNTITIKSQPADVDDTATTIIYSLPKEIQLAPSESRDISAIYRDPSTLNERISAIDLVDPLVADTDYKMSSVSGDDGNDLNASLGVSLSVGGNATKITLTNNASVTGYVNHLQLRGKGVYLYNKNTYVAEDSASQSTYGTRSTTIDLPYQDDFNVSVDIADALLDQYKDPMTYVDSVTFNANRSDALMTAALDLEPGDMVTITETLTGINTNFFIQSVDLDIKPNKIIHCTWGLKYSTVEEYWILQDAVYGILGSTTVLGW
jgi:hypothetical protein